MKINSTLLLQQLAAIARQDLQTAIAFKTADAALLNQRPAPGAWSALQCLEHLNLYAAFYIPEIEKTLKSAGSATPVFKSGLVGNMLVKMVQPKEYLKKMKTFQDMDPAGKALPEDVLEKFITYQQRLLELVNLAKTTNLNQRGVAVTFTSLIKLRQGDALCFMVYHNQRHVQQAAKAAL